MIDLTTSVQQLAIGLIVPTGNDSLVLAETPLSDHEFAQLMRLCENHRLLGMLSDAVEAGRVAVTDDQFESLSKQYLMWLTHCLEVERLLVQVGECLDRHAIEMRVLKGVALAHLVYQDPSSRVFADLDVLIPASRFDDAVRVVRNELGGVQPIAELRPGFNREFGKEVLIRVGSIELDLHRTLVAGPFGLTVPLEELFADSTAFEVGGRPFRALGPNAMLMHAFYNVALGDLPVRLCSLRDLMLLVDRHGVGLDDVRELARRWRADAVVQRAAGQAIETLALPADHDLWQLATCAVPRRQRWALRSYLGSARSYRRQLASLLVIKGVRPRVRYVWALVRPSAVYLQSRGWSERSHIRRAMSRLRGGDHG